MKGNQQPQTKSANDYNTHYTEAISFMAAL